MLAQFVSEINILPKKRAGRLITLSNFQRALLSQTGEIWLRVNTQIEFFPQRASFVQWILLCRNLSR